jgi:hypothetical protein
MLNVSSNLFRFPFKQKNDLMAIIGVKKEKDILIQGQSQLWIPPPGIYVRH